MLSSPFAPDFSPFAANPLRLCSVPCYHCPMSHINVIAMPVRPDHPPLNFQAPFPKWNGSHSALLPTRHSSLVTRHCIPNRNTPKLKFPVTHTKQSLGQFLIATFRALAPMHIEYAPAPSGSPETRKLENHLTRFQSATSKFLIDNFEPARRGGFSRHSFLIEFSRGFF